MNKNVNQQKTYCNEILKELKINELLQVFNNIKRIINKTENKNTLEEIEFALQNLNIDINDLKRIINKEINMKELKSKKMISVRLDIEDYIELQNILKKEGITLTELIRKLIKEYIEKNTVN